VSETLDETLSRRIEGFLRAQLPAAQDVAVTGLDRATPSLSRENWLFDAQWLEDGRRVSRELILRREPVVQSIESNDEREFRLIQALHDRAPFPVPEALWLDLSGDWLERPFIVMERMRGVSERTLIADESKPLELRVALAREFARVAGQLHALDWRAAGLEFLQPPRDGGEAAERAIAYWTGGLLADPEPSPMLALVVGWLRRNRPQDGPLALVHGDLRPANLLVEGERLTALLDWETAIVSDPAEDIGWITIPSNYRREHFVAGHYEIEEFRGDYEAAGGTWPDGERLRFWQVLGVVKLWEYSAARVRQARRLEVTVGEAAGRVRLWHAWYESLLAELIEV
jgi:aminoglycoside phosphotransferase (APT) family kinase protein